MRYLFGFLCVCALGLMGCGQSLGPVGGSGGDGGGGGAAGNGGDGGCADWAGEWTLGSVSCDGVVEFDSGIDLRFAANCTGETILMISATCEEIIQMTFTPGAGDTTSVDYGANTCSAECASNECEMIADAAQPYVATVTISGDTWTMTALATQQMVSDEFTPCEVGQTMVTVAIRLVTDCTGEEDETPCGSEDPQGRCFEEVCLETNCEGLEDLTLCWYLGGPSVSGLGACVDGACFLATGVCTDDLDGIPCYYGDPASRPVELGVCEAGECVPLP